MTIKTPVYRCEWLSTIDGRYFPASEWSDDPLDALAAQERWREMGYKTIVTEDIEEIEV